LKKYVERLKESPQSAVIFGGRGCEASVSGKSAMRFICEAKEAGIELLPIFINADGAFFIYRGDPEKIGGDRPFPESELIAAEPTFGGIRVLGEKIVIDTVIPILHGDHGEDGEIQGMLSSFGIRYVGADTVCGAVAADKIYTKAVASSFGIPTLPHVLITSRMTEDEICRRISEIGYPVFVKPCRLGSSVGAFGARDDKELITLLLENLSVAERFMAEPCLLSKRELECAYFSAAGRTVISAPGEVLCDGFYDYNLKYSPSGAEIRPIADVSEKIKSTVIGYTSVLAEALSFGHMARVDYFLTGDGEIYLNEINTMPGLTSGSLYPLMLRASGVDFASFIGALLSEGR